LPWELLSTEQGDLQQNSVQPAEITPAPTNPEIKQKFRDLFFDDITSQTDFITLNTVSELALRLHEFAIEYNIPTLQDNSTNLNSAIEAFDYDKTQDCLNTILEMFND